MSFVFVLFVFVSFVTLHMLYISIIYHISFTVITITSLSLFIITVYTTSCCNFSRTRPHSAFSHSFSIHHSSLNSSLIPSSMDPIAYPSPRVSQLDSSILDNELLTLMKQHLASIFQLQTNKWWSYDQHPELWDLVLNLLLFRITVWKTGSSYGLSLQNLKLVNFRNGKLIGYSKRSLLLALIVGDYLYKKLQSYLYATEEADISRQNDGLWKAVKMFVVRHKDVLLNKAEHTFKVLNMLNFTLFLLNGKYPSLIHRVLGMSLTPIITDLLRFNGDNVNYEFQNRQLVWNVMTEFLVFILPLLQLRKLRSMSKKLILTTRNNDKQSVSDNTDSSSTTTPYSNLPMSQCAVCHRNKDYALMAGEKKTTSVSCMVTNPYVVNCGHIYCYVCAASLFNALEISDNDEGCLRCGKKLLWFKKYGEEEDDIDEDAIMVEYEEEEDDYQEKEKDSDNDNDSDSNSDSDNNSDDENHNKLNEKQLDSESSDYSEGEDYDNDNYEDNFNNFDDANVDYDDNIEL